MSTIAGIYRLAGGTVERRQLYRMIAGPACQASDRSGVWLNRQVGLANCQLMTTPESTREKQPFKDPSGSLAITADARLDNRRELAEFMGITSAEASKLTDVEFILLSYKKWGSSCTTYLLGDFAFAIWDGARQEMFCARDHMGVRPLFYHLSDRLFAFASNLPALAALDEIPLRLNESKVADYLVGYFNREEDTFYQDILRLPKARCLTVTPHGSKGLQYWCPQAGHELKLASDQEYAEAFQEVFGRAVDARLRSAYPVGSKLSGGLDSSAILAFASRSRQRPGRLHTFSARFCGIPEVDEGEHMEAARLAYEHSWHEVELTGTSPVSCLSYVWKEYGQPLFAPNYYLVRALWACARQQGVRVLLDGYDGDAVLGLVYEHVAELAADWRLGEVICNIERMSTYYDVPLPQITWAFAIKPLLPHWLRVRYRRLRAALTPEAEEFDMVHPELASRLRIKERILELKTSAIPEVSRSDSLHLLRLMAGDVTLALEVMTNASQSLSVELAFPFFDKRVVDFCLSLPARLKLRDGWNRYVMRLACERLLPASIVWRPVKSDYSRSFVHNLKCAPASEQLKRVFENRPQLARKLLNQSWWERSYRKLMNGGGSIHAIRVWRGVTLMDWLARI